MTKVLIRLGGCTTVLHLCCLHTTKLDLMCRGLYEACLRDQYSVFILSHIVSIYKTFFSETHMIYLTMYNEDQKYSSCVCLDDKPEKEKKKHMKVGNYQNPQLK